MNQTLLVGKLAKDPELKELESGKKVSNLTLAVQRSYKNTDGVYETDFINCSVWNNIAETTCEYCHKGDVIGIRGRIQTRSIETEQGKRNEIEVVADKISFLSNAKEKENSDEMDLV